MTALTSVALKSRPRVLLLGCGSIGRRHAQNLRELGVQELIVFDLQAERRDQLATELNVDTVTTLDECWKRRPDAVVIALPTAFHLPLALEAARRGCHLLIEKPLADRWQGVEELLAIAEQRDLITLVGCNLRFHPGLRHVKCLLAEQAVGRVIAARIEVGQYLPDWHPWEDYRQSYSARRELGGGVILDAIHELDYARWLLGEIAMVTCCAEKLSALEIDTEDTAAIIARCANGAIVEIHLDYVQRAYRRTCQIIGAEGTIHWDYGAGEVCWYSAHDRRWQIYSNPVGWQPNQMYIDEMSHFLSCLDGAEKPALDVRAGAEVLRVALAAKLAARERRWIDLGGDACNLNATL
jgi:predicted dehydrogenase